LAEEGVLGESIVHAESTPYQRILVTRTSNGFQLHLNGHLQFNSVDEYRYHESLVHPAFSAVKNPRRVLVLGGGDGLAVREILRYPSIESVWLVDLDSKMTTLSERFEPLDRLNQQALRDRRVTIVNEDAFLWVGRTQEKVSKFDAAIIDFPDPGSFAIGKLYTSRFYRMLQNQLDDNAVIAVQCTSPLVAPRSYWCIVRTLESVGNHVRPYHTPVPSFGEWGFVLASKKELPEQLELSSAIQGSLRYLTDETLNNLFTLPADLKVVETEINQLNNQALVHYYDQEWNLTAGR